MNDSSFNYLNSDELRLLTRRGSTILQISRLMALNVAFTLDEHGCPLVIYEDAKPFFILQGVPLPRGLPSQN